MNSCRFINQRDFIEDMDNLVSSLIKNEENPKEAYTSKEIRQKFIKEMSDLRDKYVTDDESLKDFDSSVKEYLSDDEGYYAIGDYIIGGHEYLSTLKDVDYAIEIKTVTKPRESKTDSLSSPRTFGQGQFIQPYFIQNSTSKVFFLKDFRNRFARTLFINQDDELFDMENAEELTSSIMAFQNQLISEIYNSLATFVGEAVADTFRSIGNLNDALNYAKTFFEGTHKSIIARIPLLEENPTDSRDWQAKGYMAWAALSNFDRLISDQFGKAIIIKNPGQFDAFYVKDKYSIKTGDRNARNWRAEDRETDETEELSNLPVLFLESLPMYKNGVKQNRTLQFDRVKSAIGAISNILNMHNNPPIKDSIIDILEDEYAGIYGKDQFDDIANKFLKGKTINEVFASAKMHPRLLPLFFRLLQPLKSSEGAILDVFLTKNSNEINIRKQITYQAEVIESIYRNIYSPGDSLFTKNQFKPNERSIYNYIGTLFLNIESKPQMEYTETPEDGVTVTSLYDKNSNERMNLYSYQLEGKYNKVNPITFRNFKIIDDDLDNGRVKIEYKNYIIESFKGSKLTVTNKETGEPVSAKEINANIKDFFDFLSEVLEIPIDSNFLSKFAETYKEDSESDLVRLSANILYHYTVGKHIIDIKASDFKNSVSTYYGDLEPKQQRYSIQPSLVQKPDYTIFENVSKAKDIIEGYAGLNTVRDGARKSLSTLGLSALVSKTGEIFANEHSDPNSPAHGLAFFNMLQGFELMRDYSGMGETKEAKKFTAAELAAASILYDMYGDMYTEDETGLHEKADGILRVMGPIVADKSNLIKLKYGWETKLPNGKTLRQATNDDLKALIKKDFGNYYKKVYNNIKKQFEIVNRYLPEGATVEFNYDSNFQEANQAYGNNAAKVLHQAIYNAQEAGEEVEIIDQVSYIGNSTIQNNPSLFHQMSIFGVLPPGITTSLDATKENYESFWKRKEFQIVSDFLRQGVSLKIKSGQNLRKGTVYKAAEMLNKEIKDDKGNIIKPSFIRGQYIIPAILYFGEDKYSIGTKSDLIECYPYSRLRRDYLKLGEIPSQFDINSPDFDFEATLNEINRRSLLWEGLNNIEKIAKLKPFSSFNKPQKRRINLKSRKIIDRLFTRKYSINSRTKFLKIGRKKLKNELKTKKDLDNTIRDYLNTYYNDPKAHQVYKEQGYPDVNTVLNSLEITPKPCTITINPELIKHNLYDFLLEGEYTLATTGTYIAHPTKENSSITSREAAQFGQAIKRYVSYTASKHREQTNQLDGITEDLNIAVIDDLTAQAYGLAGQGKTKPYDGASFIGGTMNYLDNNSLGGDAMGIDKKPFGHSLGRNSGIGFIWKTAGFPMTNERLRTGDKSIRILNKHMLDIKWDSVKIKNMLGDEDLDWTKDYNDNDIDYGQFYVYNPTEKQWYLRKVEKGIPYQIKVDVTGEYQEDGFSKYELPINSNYDLWKFFGGEYSGHKQGSKLTYINDNSSFVRLTQAQNCVGIRKYSEDTPVFDQDGVDQILKKAQIHMIATAGSVKYGGANINSAEAYFDENYPITYMTIKAYDIGEQLDAEHNAEDENVSLMTQVMNALGARGYTAAMAQECYEALAAIADVMNKDSLEGLMILNNPNLSPQEKEVGRDMLKNSLAELIYQIAKRANNNDNDMFNALVSTLTNFNNKTFSWDDISGKFPISHPAIFNKMVSSIASALEKSIRQKFEGNMLVLNPSEERFTTINGHLSGYYNDHPEELKELQAYKDFHPVTVAELKLGFNYKNLGTGEVFLNINPRQLQELKQAILNEDQICEIVQDEDGNPVGHNLACYQVSFEDTAGNPYNSWEIDCIRQLYDWDGKGFLIPSQKTDEDKVAFQTNLQANWDRLDSDEKSYNAIKFPELVELLTVQQQEELTQIEHYPEEWDIFTPEIALRQEMQNSLNALSSQGLETTVVVDGKVVKVNKAKTVEAPYEAVLPMMYKSEFGLREGDAINEILNDKTFFIKRAIQNIKPKISDSSLYDIELKSLSGNHIYLGYTLPDEETLYENLDPVEFSIGNNTEFDGDTLYRIDALGNRLYSIPYTRNADGSISTDVQIFKVPETGQEIIYSKHLSHFLDSFQYIDLLFGHNSNSNKKELLQEIQTSSNKVVARKIKRITKIASNNVQKNFLKQFKGKDRSVVASLFLGIEESLPIDELFEVYDYSFEDVLESPELLEQAIRFIDSESEYYYKELRALETDSEKDIDKLLSKHRLFYGLIKSGEEVHTSFDMSLEHIVSRTPAQSQQSFMAMRVAAFTNESTNTAYVGKNQLLYQGSDYDIDKVSILGLKFRNGRLITWSPYFNLKNKETAEASKMLPFPTGKELEIGEGNKIPYDELPNDLIVSESDDFPGALIISTQSGQSLIIAQSPETGEVGLISPDWENISKFDRYKLIRRAVRELKDYKGEIIFNGFDLDLRTRAAIGLNGENVLTGNIDIVKDFEEFNDSIFPVNFNLAQIPQIKDNIIEIAPQLGTLIRVYNKLGYIPELSNQTHLYIKSLIDTHNTCLKGKEKIHALRNFISIKAKDISKDPSNQIQAQAAIDTEVQKLENILKNPKLQKLSGSTTHVDRGSVYSKYYMLTLTLAGKDNVGIEASQLKNFEAISQHIYQVLNFGTKEEQESLLFNIRINGRDINLIANSKSNNPDTIKSEAVEKALLGVDQNTDAYLVLSALLSAATDNTKNPILPKLNAGQALLPLYNAGVMLGIPMEELAELMLSDTGLILDEISKSNVFTGRKSKGTISSVINYLENPPSSLLSSQYRAALQPILKDLGLIPADTNFLSIQVLGNTLQNRNLHPILLRLFRFLLSPSEDAKILEITQDDFVKNQINILKQSWDYRRYTSYKAEQLAQLNAKDENSLTAAELSLKSDLEQQRLKKEVIKEKIKDLEDWRKTGISTNAEVSNVINSYNKLSSKEAKERIAPLKKEIWNDYTLKTNLEEIADWIRYKQIYKNDMIIGQDGKKHVVLYQLKKLAEVAQEQSALRPMLALNQSIPNKVEEQLSFLNNFGKIISDRLQFISEKRRNNLFEEDNLLEKLKEMNESLGILNPNPYYIDLNSFIYNPAYKQLVKDIYGKIKCAVNIFDVIDNVAHYKKYLEITNLAIQKSRLMPVYQTLQEINDAVIPKMGTQKKQYVEQMLKNASNAVYRKIHKQYLQSKKVSFKIPAFKIEDNNIIYDEPKAETTIILGTKAENQKFKDWFQYIEFPRLQEKYPDNAFIKYLGYRIYDYNEDHNQSSNLAKIKRVNDKNLIEKVEFDNAKRGLSELLASEIDLFFYYNLIAYNNSPGQLSLTSLFEDLITENNISSIKDYNAYIANLDNQTIFNLTDPLTVNQLQKEIAPVVSTYELQGLKIPYVYVKDKDTNKVFLCEKSSVDGDNEYEGFDGILNDAGYHKIGTVSEDSGSQNLSIGEYTIVPNDNLGDIRIHYGENKYSVKDLIKAAESKMGEKLTPSKLIIRKKNPKTKEYVYNLDEIKTRLDNILKEENKCKI